jgi:hypothetical protein
VRADGNGHFFFQHVEPGQYKLMAERQGFYSDQSKREYQPMLEVAAGEHIKNLPVRLMPTAVIAGEIVDEYNDPLQNVEVRLLATGSRLGRMYLTMAGKTNFGRSRTIQDSRTASGKVLPDGRKPKQSYQRQYLYQCGSGRAGADQCQ